MAVVRAARQTRRLWTQPDAIEEEAAGWVHFGLYPGAGMGMKCDIAESTA